MQGNKTESDPNPGIKCVTKLTLGVTTAGDISEENRLRAYNMLLSIAVDEDRPCKKDAFGKDIKRDMTPAMKKAKKDAGIDKMDLQDEEVKKVSESGRSSASVCAESAEKNNKTGIRLGHYNCETI